MERKLRLLIADDDAYILETWKDSFELLDSKNKRYEIIAVSTGREALKYIEEGISALFTDGSMDGKGPNGIGLIKAARSYNLPHENIALCTGEPDKYQHEARDLNIRVLPKPTDLSLLKEYFECLK